MHFLRLYEPSCRRLSIARNTNLQAFGIQTGASGINSQGDFVGTYSDGSGQTLGFLLSTNSR
jgi:hypothetical protein